MSGTRGSIDHSQGEGIGLVTREPVWLVGAITRPTKSDPDRYWFAANIAKSPTSEASYLFCEEDQFEKLHARLQETNGPVQGVLTLQLLKRNGQLQTRFESFEPVDTKAKP